MALTFNGSTSQLVSAARIITSYPAAAFFWAKPTSATPNTFAFDHGTDGEELGAYLHTDGVLRGWSRHLGSGSGPSSAASLTTSWQPMMLVWTSGTSCTVYLGGGSPVTGDPGVGTVIFASTDRLYVGRWVASSAFQFAGDLACLATWQGTVPDATDWATLAGGAVPSTVKSGSLLDYWSMQTQGATQTGVNGAVLTATSTSQASDHPISEGGGGSGITRFNPPMRQGSMGGNFQG